MIRRSERTFIKNQRVSFRSEVKKDSLILLQKKLAAEAKSRGTARSFGSAGESAETWIVSSSDG